MPAIQNFLKERGLNLSLEKTKITRIEDGFDFLGQQLRKYGEKLIITPSKSSVKSILTKIKQIAKSYLGHATSKMIEELNPVIRGWANYHRHVCSKETFRHIGNCIFIILWNWVRRRHRNKGKRWIKKHYFRTIGLRNWVFYGTQKGEKGKSRVIDLLQTSTIKIVRHVKIRGKANQYSRDGQGYFAKRKHKKYSKPFNYIPSEVTEQLGHLNAEVGLRRA